MMQTARASRVYTTDQIAPLLDHEQSKVYRAIESVHQVLDEHLPAALQKAIDRLPSQREKQVLQNVRQQILESVRQEPREMPSAVFFPQCIPFYAATEARPSGHHALSASWTCSSTVSVIRSFSRPFVREEFTLDEVVRICPTKALC
jgi:hypothetical protein